MTLSVAAAFVHVCCRSTTKITPTQAGGCRSQGVYILLGLSESETPGRHYDFIGNHKGNVLSDSWDQFAQRTNNTDPKRERALFCFQSSASMSLDHKQENPCTCAFSIGKNGQPEMTSKKECRVMFFYFFWTNNRILFLTVLKTGSLRSDCHNGWLKTLCFWGLSFVSSLGRRG